jgi:DNA-binding NarL/FixJ family response regulator
LIFKEDPVPADQSSVGVNDGRRAAPAVRQRRALEPPQPESRPAVREPLTAREVEILTLIADGFFNREIAAKLFLSEDTVKTHIHHVLGKLRARSRAHAAAIGLRSSLID